MLCYKIHLILAAASASIVGANFHYEHFKTFGIQAEDTKPWYFEDLILPQASQLTSNYHDPVLTSDTSSYDPYFGSSTKIIPREDKSFKKPIYPFHIISDKDHPKYKSMILKSGLPFCQKVKHINDGSSDDESVICYKCKDPKTGLNYEYCSKFNNPSTTRIRRSNSEETSVENTESPHGKNEDYRFSEEYFLPQASLPVEYKKKNEKCERVVKDSMVCMVCKNPKTNGKYEQCSYVTKPNEKAYAYSKSSSFSGPRIEEQGESSAKKPVRARDGWQTHPGIREESAETSSSAESEEDEDETDSTKSSPKYDHATRYVNHEIPVKDNPSSSSTVSKTKGCKKIRRDSQTCVICKDPKTDSNSEKCFYEYQPSDKVYKFSRTKSFGYPKVSSSYEKKNDDSAEESESNPRQTSEYVNNSPKYQSYSDPHGSSESKEDYDDNPSVATSEYDSDAEKVAEETKNSDCKEVQKDSMTCTICKNPKNGGNSERCTYSYKPNDKLFSYSKSKSFGSPTESKGTSYDSGEETVSVPYKRKSDYSEEDGYKFATEEKPKRVKNNASNSNPGTSFSAEWESKINPCPLKQPVRPSAVDIGYFDTSKRKAEIEKFLEEFQAQDRSKCQKIMRNKMTCYQCTDENGFQKEECMYVTAPETMESRPIELQLSSEITNNRRTEKKKKVKREPAKSNELLEPMASASDDSYVVKVKPDSDEKSDEKKDDEEETEKTDEELSKEAEPYDTASETKYRFDKVLGFSLPQYMLETSEQEAEFDDFVASYSS